MADGPDASIHVHDGARSQSADVSGAGCPRTAPCGIASQQSSGIDRKAYEGERLSYADVFTFHRTPASNTGWRRFVTGSLADRLWQRYERWKRAHRFAVAIASDWW